MAYVDDDGLRVEPVRPLSMTDDEIARSRDIIIVRLRQRRLPWRKIGKYVGMSHEGARHRWRSMPPEAREYYSRTVPLA